MRKKVGKEGKIVETYHLGATTVHINDACCATTEEEIEKVLDNYHRAGWVIVEELIAAGKEV